MSRLDDIDDRLVSEKILQLDKVWKKVINGKKINNFTFECAFITVIVNENHQFVLPENSQRGIYTDKKLLGLH